MTKTPDTKMTILQGPDGRLYEFPEDVLSQYAIPGDRVAKMRAEIAGNDAPQTTPTAPVDTEATPEAAPQPAGLPSISMQPTAGGGVVLNFFFGQGAQLANQDGHTVEGYHLAEEHGVQMKHTDVKFGSYIDKQGNAAVGLHSHDPITGNAL